MDEDPGRDLNQVWQTQPTEEVRMALDEVRTHAHKLEKATGRRNLLEYLGAAIVIIATTVNLVFESNVAVVVGGMLLALGTLYVVYHLRTWGTVRPMSADLGLRDCLDFHRAELVRQRDLLRSVWYWYLLPLVPGAAVIIIGRAIERPDRRMLALIVGTAFVIGFVIVGKLNERGARKVQRLIDALDASR